MQDSIRLSIIVPCYNLYGYVDKTIASLLNQNVEKNQYEIILVDDGSTDNTLEVIEKFANENSNVRVISQQNAGVSRARNNGLKNALGKYVWFVDGDDIIRKNCLKSIFDVLDKESPDLMRFSMSSFIDGIDSPLTTKKVEDISYDVCYDNEKVYKFTYERVGGSICNHLFRRQLLISEDIFFNEELKFSEDAFFGYNVLTRSNCVVKTKENFYFYRQRSTSAMHKSNDDEFIDSMYHLALSYNEISKLNKENWKKVSKNKRNFAVKALLFNLVRKGDLKFAKEMVKKLKQDKLYPYPLLFESLVGNKTFKQGLINYVSFFFPCKLYFYTCVIIRGLFKRKK